MVSDQDVVDRIGTVGDSDRALLWHFSAEHWLEDMRQTVEFDIAPAL